MHYACSGKVEILVPKHRTNSKSTHTANSIQRSDNIMPLELIADGGTLTGGVMTPVTTKDLVLDCGACTTV